ncbi:MAG: KTSC domain-containing protein [Chthoniobacterales bacterium]|nr:KTSC domain-containing protein [Chthoniobacterales bacterium]
MKLNRAPVLLVLAAFSAAIAAAYPGEVVRSRIKREPVISSNVASVGYSRNLRALEIEFTRGAVYRFLDVPSTVHRGLIASESKGRFIAENIRGKYRFVRIQAPRTRLAGETSPTP